MDSTVIGGGKVEKKRNLKEEKDARGKSYFGGRQALL